MVTIKHDVYDTIDYLTDEQDMIEYLEAALEDGDPALVAQALSTIAQARGIETIAHDTGLSKKALKEVFSPEGKPEFSSVLKVVHALGIRLHAAMEHAAQ